MDLRGKRLLVIGGAGLIGSHTVDELVKTDVEEILVYDNFSRGREENLATALRDPRVSVYSPGGDILHRDILDSAMKGIHGVFHFAGLWLLHCHDYPRAAFEVNIAGTFNVLEAIAANGVKRLVYSSSGSVYGDAVEEPMTEDHPYRNNNLYGATKIAGEQMCRALHHRYRGTAKHFDYVGLRYMNVYGPRQEFRGDYVAVIMKMLARIDAGLAPTVYGDGTQAYDFIHVTDCARANVCAMEAEVTDEFYNVGKGVKTTVTELAELLISLTGAQTGIDYDPTGLTFVRNRVASPAKAARDLGFTANVELQHGLRTLLDWRARHIAEHEANKDDGRSSGR